MPIPILSHTRLLLVEDDAAIRATLTELLREEGCIVTPVHNGQEALAELRESTPPDVIVLDLMMPIMDGWEFRVEQRADPLLAGIPVIAMSADISAKARAIAADAYVRKPIDFEDLTKRIRDVVDQATRRRMAVADRMAALGTLVSGIAHEINNPLTYVIANLQVLQDRVPSMADDPADADDLRELLADTMDGVERIGRIVKQAQMVAPARAEARDESRAGGEGRAASGGGVPRDPLVDLEAVLERVLGVLGGELGRRARLVKDVSGRAYVRGDRGRVEQLFVNLLQNAAQAIEAAEPRPDHEIRVTLRALPSHRALLEIADTGAGVPVEIRERIFQPFFTTRPVGQGTGLGLSICQGIVTALGGELTFQSQVGAGAGSGSGSVFRAVLPTVDVGVGRSEMDLLTNATRRRQVLVVDNETTVLRVVREILEPAHEVTTATDAADALALVRAGQRFDVILSELMLPGTDGLALRDELERTTPELAHRMVFMTTNDSSARARSLLGRSHNPWLVKPFDREQLFAAIAIASTSEP